MNSIQIRAQERKLINKYNKTKKYDDKSHPSQSNSQNCIQLVANGPKTQDDNVKYDSPVEQMILLLAVTKLKAKEIVFDWYIKMC